VYSLGRNPAESERLRRQADELHAASAALLDRTGLRPGQAAIDLGCGPRGIIDLLAERVAPGGRVVGLDADPGHTAMAAQFAADQQLAAVEIITADARRTGLSSESFDLVHSRTLLVNVPEPAEVVAEMMRLARPGGWIAVMEPDTEFHLCYPPLRAFTRINEIFLAAARRNGADPLIGRRVTELLWQAGLEDVGVDAVMQMFPAGHSRRTIRLDLVRSMWSQIAAMGLADEAELEEMDAEARAHLHDPRTVAIYGPMFQAWGRKPTPNA
jgi:ubiquinone/menaquinone biosynthesis C-methylase UbiE